MTDRLTSTPIRRRTLLASGGGLALMAINGPLAGAGVRDSHHAGTPRREQDLPQWDTRSDTWSATDALGRTLPTHEEVGPVRDDRFVGMFYFLWMGEHSNSGPYNVSHILAEHPEAANDKEHPAWGPLGDYHWWEESQYGYYLSSDQWVVRRHARMLVDAGIDVIIFDVTNGFDYRDNYMALLDTFAQIRAEGGQTPGVAFLCPWNAAQPLVKKLYQDMYAEGIHEDLWFQWKGKPLVLSNPDLLEADEHGDDTLTNEVLDFFTFRAARADYFLPQDAPGQWSWLQDHPQNVFVNDDGTPEQLAVSTAQNAVGGRLGAMSEPAAQGRSFHNDTVPTDSSHIREGLNFQEQWDTALKIDPEFVFITGWNEWVAMRFEEWSEAKGEAP